MTRVLILDDRPINRQFLTTLLQHNGFETREASDGLEGLEVARGWPPDLAIVDIQMPGMDGVEFVEHLHAEADPKLASTPIIFYTASYAASEASRMAKACGVADVLMKASEPEVILATVDKALGRSAQRPKAAAEAAVAEFVHLHAAALRTSALIEFHLEVAAQREPVEILKLLSRAVRNVVASQHSVVAMFDGDRPFGYSSSRDERAPLPNEGSGWLEGCAEALKARMNQGHVLRTTHALDRNICEAWGIDVESYLGVPIQTAKTRYGWLSLMNREGVPQYTIEDERIALTIVAQAATAYENLLLYEEVRKEAELLDHNVSLLRATIEASGDGILVIDNQSRYVTFNQSFVDIWHMPESILNSGDAHRSRQHTLSQVKDPKALDAVMQAGSNEEVSGTYELLDGRFIECRVAPRHFEGQVIGHVWSFRDLTARMRAEESLQRVARDRELLLESTGEGIYAMDTEGRCTMANHVATNLLGRTLGEMVGSRCHALFHHHKSDGSPYPAEACAVYSAFRAGKPVRITDEVFWRKDGTSFPVEYVSSPIIDDEIVRGAVVTFSDVTERRRLERRLEQIGRINSLGRMAVTIGHEFNNVLMGIQPFAEVIRRRAGDDAKLQQAATQILNSVTRGKGITQDIMRMTKSPEPNLQSVDVTPWLEQLAVEIRALVGKSVAVDLQLPPSGTLYARFDPSQMQQVMTNLALNARDAMPGGGTLSLSAKRSEAGARLVIGDTGCGITPETLPFIFEPLFTTKHSGTGLGLAVAQQLVIRNGGTISVESSVGGTWFHIDLAEAPAATARAGDAVSVPRTYAGVRRVVIVEDDPIVASGLTSVLESEDVKVRVVSRGSEAMNAVAAFDPDAVVIDISLPDVSGTVVYEQIVARWPKMGIIFSTGHAEESGLPQASSRHVGFLRKPYSSDTLLTKLREVV